MILVSCKNNAGNEHEIQEEVRIEDAINKPVWKILGTEPFWNIYIHEDTVLYSRLNENTDTIYFENHHYSDRDSIIEFHLMDGNKKEAELVIRKEITPCSDGMSDNTYEYSATFAYGNEILRGCATKQ